MHWTQGGHPAPAVLEAPHVQDLSIVEPVTSTNKLQTNPLNASISLYFLLVVLSITYAINVSYFTNHMQLI